MRSDKTDARMWRLQASANELVLNNKREPEPLMDFLQEFVFGNVLPDINWPLTYQRLGMETEYKNALKTLVIPSENPQLWILPMIQGVTCNRVVAAFRQDKVRVYTYVDDLDARMKSHDRDPSNSYLIGFRRAIEADEDNKGKSANDLAADHHRGITLPERLVLDYGYYVTTEEHLDIKCVTLCAGSRGSGGGVPSVHYGPGYRGVHVGCCSPDVAGDYLRSRSVVSLAA